MKKRKKMLKLILLSIGFICASLPYVNTITVDNQNAANNDCFQRIYAEAMIPPDRTFRTSDTNSVQVCQDLCMAEGMRCQSFALGISSRGNGTCQLSGERIAENAARRPRNTIYDPDFNLYQRKINCGIQDNNDLPGSNGVSALPTIPSINSDRPTSTVLTTMTNTPTQLPSDTTAFNDMGSSMQPVGTNPSMSDRPSTFSDGQHDTSVNPTYTNVPISTTTDTGKYTPPTTGITTTSDRFPTTSVYGTTNTDLYTNEIRPPTYPSPFDSNTKPDLNYPYPPHYHHKYNYYQDIYPMLYDHSYLMPNTPNGYAQNVPAIGYQPTVDYYGGTMGGSGGGMTSMNRPNEPPPSPTYGSNTGNPTTYMGNGWSNADEINNRRKQNGMHSTRPTMSMQPNGYHPEGKYNRTRPSTAIPHIRTYFNPDDYYPNEKRRPTNEISGGSGSYPGGHSRPSSYDYFNRPCFRRALAGKRVAPQWIRRTLTCERVEDCQAECGHEKRFICEGFNYCLDPSGRGQGICELIDVPLSEMDIYSSANRRDENLLYHPDYDYYERDRNACRPSLCKDCTDNGRGGKPYLPESSGGYNDNKPPYYSETPSGYSSGGGGSNSHTGSGKPYLPAPPHPPSDYNNNNNRPTTYRPIDNFKPYPDAPPPSHESSSGYGSSSDRFRPPYSTAIDKYRPPPFEQHHYEHRPASNYDERPYEYDRFEISNQYSSSSIYRPPPSYDLDRYDGIKPTDYSEISIYSGPHYNRPNNFPPHDDDYRPNRRPERPPTPNEYLGPYKPPPYEPSYSSFGYRPKKPDRFPVSAPAHSYLDREREIPPPPPLHSHTNRKQSKPYIPYTINKENAWGSYGGNYGGNYNYNQQSHNFWGLSNDVKRKDQQFDYFNLGNKPKFHPEENSVLSYPGSKYDQNNNEHDKDKSYYGSLWTRRPSQDECSVKTSEGFRLHKAVVRFGYNVPTVTACEKMCHSENKFHCVTYSYRYSPLIRDNCLLCDRPMSHLDYYSDVEPDRDYDIYSMSDDPQMCNQPPNPNNRQLINAQCFFRAIETSRFFKSIVRDSLAVRSVGECEMECIKSTKFTCRAFSYRYGPKTAGSIIDNCQLSDWPVRDMDKERHLIHDSAFDVYERASYGHGCEIQPISDDKHKKLCYLGYGSPAKLLSSSIKKVLSVPTELDCKNECIRLRENTPFKCYSFSFGSQASTFNCEMSDLDQSELKLNVNYAHTNERDYWLFAWNPFDLTCRDKVATIGGSNRVNNDRRMDIFREPDGENTWSHFTVSGKACRIGSSCDKNIITGFYSCEIDGDEIGAWDYCCKSDYPCGYSQGFDYPWCFVGDGTDQWRTCSDRYYPLSSSGSSQIAVTTTSSNNKKKTSAISYTPNKRKGDQYHQQPPRPGGLQNLEDIASARLWPVTYLYSSGPPNSTELSNFVDCNKENC